MVCFLSSVNIARLSPVVRAGLHLETKGCDVSPKGTAIPSLLSLQPRRAERQRALQDGTQYHQRQYLVRVRPSQNPSGGRWCCRGRRRHCHDIASGIKSRRSPRHATLLVDATPGAVSEPILGRRIAPIVHVLERRGGLSRCSRLDEADMVSRRRFA